jgi:hypothetical protein
MRCEEGERDNFVSDGTMHACDAKDNLLDGYTLQVFCFVLRASEALSRLSGLGYALLDVGRLAWAQHQKSARSGSCHMARLCLCSNFLWRLLQCVVVGHWALRCWSYLAIAWVHSSVSMLPTKPLHIV